MNLALIVTEPAWVPSNVTSAGFVARESLLVNVTAPA